MPATDSERHHHPITQGELGDRGALLDNPAHEFMAKNVATFHGRHVAMVEVQV